MKNFKVKKMTSTSDINKEYLIQLDNSVIQNASERKIIPEQVYAKFVVVFRYVLPVDDQQSEISRINNLINEIESTCEIETYQRDDNKLDLFYSIDTRDII